MLGGSTMYFTVTRMHARRHAGTHAHAHTHTHKRIPKSIHTLTKKKKNLKTVNCVGFVFSDVPGVSAAIVAACQVQS